MHKNKFLIRFRTFARMPFMAEDKLYSSYEIGEWSYGKPKVLSWGEGTTLKIGRFCSFAGGVVIFLGGEHRTDWVTTYPFQLLYEDARTIEGHPKSKGDVNIQNDVWVGQDAMILSGVTIGNGSVIAARSVVTRDVPSYSIVAGNPAHLVRMRFSQSQIERLEQIAWWNWPVEEIKKAQPLLLSTDIDAFIEKYSQVGPLHA